MGSVIGRPSDRRRVVDERDMIEMRIPLDAQFASLLRVTVASVAADRGFTVDEIDDLRLGVSEVFATLTADRERDRCVVLMSVEPDAVVVTLGLEPGGTVPELDALATTILSSVVDEFRVSEDGFVLVKRAVESAAAR
jgi:anti-sigma regulatory factor (Ser/Thr protein kinase)